MKIVLANGCFDLLHAGHVAHLKAARAMGDMLIVSLTVDEHVNKGSGRPIYVWEDRAAILRELRCVDAVEPSSCSVEAILRLKPSIFAKGIDYHGCLPQADIDACAAVGAEIRFTDTPKMSATEIIRRVQECA